MELLQIVGVLFIVAGLVLLYIALWSTPRKRSAYTPQEQELQAQLRLYAREQTRPRNRL